jgi:hypothetical protein
MNDTLVEQLRGALVPAPPELCWRAASLITSLTEQVERLTEALTAIRDYAPEEAKDGTGPYTQIALFARATARAALNPQGES